MGDSYSPDRFPVLQYPCTGPGAPAGLAGPSPTPQVRGPGNLAAATDDLAPAISRPEAGGYAGGRPRLVGAPRVTVGIAKTWAPLPRRGARRRRRGRKSKTAMSLGHDKTQGSVVWERGDLCNSPSKSDPAKKTRGREHLRAAEAPHLPCQVYEGKKKKRSENDYVVPRGDKSDKT